MEPMRTRTIFLMILVLCAAALLVGCGSAAPSASPTLESAPEALATPAGAPTATAPAAGEIYPPPTPAPADAYPAEGQATATPAPYPPAEETFLEPRFRFDQPVSVTATTITGQAPPNTPLAIMDVTFNGVLLGTGRSDDSGRFSIPVSGLVEGNRIGIGIGELAEGQTLNQMAEQYFPYRGEGFMNLPNVGIFFDTVLVGP